VRNVSCCAWAWQVKFTDQLFIFFGAPQERMKSRSVAKAHEVQMWRRLAPAACSGTSQAILACQARQLGGRTTERQTDTQDTVQGQTDRPKHKQTDKWADKSGQAENDRQMDMGCHTSTDGQMDTQKDR
jgi:hypothetical protein